MMGLTLMVVVENIMAVMNISDGDYNGIDDVLFVIIIIHFLYSAHLNNLSGALNNPVYCFHINTIIHLYITNFH